MPFPEIPLNDIVDLTVSADEDEEPQGYGTASGRDKMHTNRTQPPDARPGNQRSPSSLKRSPKGATPTKSSAQHDRTPSKSARFTRPPVREDHSSGGTGPNAALQTSAHPSKGYQTPKTLTPKKVDWTVDKIASQLATFASEVDKVHARLVHYTLQETFKRAPRPRHLSSIDDFADMPSTAVESEKATGSTMAVKFKVSAEPGPQFKPKLRILDIWGAKLAY